MLAADRAKEMLTEKASRLVREERELESEWSSHRWVVMIVYIIRTTHRLNLPLILLQTAAELRSSHPSSQCPSLDPSISLLVHVSDIPFSLALISFRALFVSSAILGILFSLIPFASLVRVESLGLTAIISDEPKRAAVGTANDPLKKWLPGMAVRAFSYL